MGNLDINIAALFKYAYAQYRNHFSFVFGVMFTYFAVGLLPQIFIYQTMPKQPTTKSEIIYFVALLLRLFLSLGFTKVMLYLVEDRPTHTVDLINNARLLPSYTLGYFLYYIAVVAGLILLIVPGIYLAVRLQFFSYYIIEYEDDAFTALQKSWYGTSDFVWELALFGICFLGLNFIGAALIGIGMMFTYPLTTMAMAVLFISLNEDTDTLPAPKYIH